MDTILNNTSIGILSLSRSEAHFFIVSFAAPPNDVKPVKPDNLKLLWVKSVKSDLFNTKAETVIETLLPPANELSPLHECIMCFDQEAGHTVRRVYATWMRSYALFNNSAVAFLDFPLITGFNAQMFADLLSSRSSQSVIPYANHGGIDETMKKFAAE